MNSLAAFLTELLLDSDVFMYSWEKGNRLPWSSAINLWTELNKVTGAGKGICDFHNSCFTLLPEPDCSCWKTNKQTNKKIHSCHSSSPFVYSHVVHKWNETVVFIGLCRNIVKLSLSVVGTPELVLWFQTGCSIACPVFLSSPDSRALWTYRVSVDLSFPPRGWISSWAFQQRGWGLWGNPALSWQTWPPAMTHAQ